MALKATIFKAELEVADMDRNYYNSHSLTLARHPSESDERMMVRLLAFALHADPQLQFGRGVSTDDEPDLWCKSDSGEIELWIDLGQPDERRITKACRRAAKVVVLCYQERAAKVWWSQNQQKLQRHDNLTVYALTAGTVEQLVQRVQRNMSLQCTLQDGQLWLSDDEQTIEVAMEVWKS